MLWTRVCLSKEAKEVASEPQGRWFPFNVDMQTLVIIEGKGAPEHLKLECLDSVVTIQEALRELEDAGEAWCFGQKRPLEGNCLRIKRVASRRVPGQDAGLAPCPVW